MLRLLGMVVTVKKKVQMISITSKYNALSIFTFNILFMEISIKLDENILPEAQFNLRSFTILTAIYTPPPLSNVNEVLITRYKIDCKKHHCKKKIC